ncbi:MAG: hypothetical protein ABEL76_09675, partial [Bradymonadaceae bacterium]
MSLAAPSHRTLAALFSLALFAVGCSSGGGNGPSVVTITKDGGSTDAVGRDAADTGLEATADTTDATDVDEGPPGARGVCTDCSGDDDCSADGAVCVDYGGNSFCTFPCGPGSPPCPKGTLCSDPGSEDRRCIPSGGCASWNPTGSGAPCTDDDDCPNGPCARAGDIRYCTSTCQAPTDCPSGFRTCIDGVCRASWETGPAGCGRGKASPLPSCSGGCPDQLSCVSDLTDAAKLSAPTKPFCTSTCSSDADCPGDTRCARTAAGDRICVDRACRCLARPAKSTMVDDALDSVGRNRCTFRHSKDARHRFPARIRRDPYRLSITERLRSYPVGLLDSATDIHGDYGANASGTDPLSDTIARASSTLDLPIDSSNSLPDVDADAPLVEALADVWSAAGKSGFDRAKVSNKVSSLPAPVREEAARILLAAADVHRAREKMIKQANLPRSNVEAVLRLLPTELVIREDFRGLSFGAPSVPQLLEPSGLDPTGLFEAARDLAGVVERSKLMTTLDVDATFSVRLDTPLGEVVLLDDQSRTVDLDDPALLVLSTGGDQHYRGPIAATPDLDHSVSVAVDVGGSDTYGFKGDGDKRMNEHLAPADSAGRYDGSHPQVGDAIGPMSNSTVRRQGTGIVGVGLLVDGGGDDTYLSHKLSQGVGLMGVGAIYDAGGSDHYQCEQACQGTGGWGIGAVVDSKGDDVYETVQRGQGYGHIRGVGYLYDGAGSDTYRAVRGKKHGGVLIYPSAQDDEMNNSMAQGVGSGRRGDSAGDGVFASGGVGLLHEGGGDDTYVAGVFAQGSGFWYGTGMLHEAGGNDSYDGRWYVHGSTAHFAVASVVDLGGDDQNEGMNLTTAVGQGHDFGIGLLYVDGGNNQIRGTGLGLGAGNQNGIGMMMVDGSKGVYTGPDSRTFGGAKIGENRANAGFGSILTGGLFLSATDDSTYTSPK